MRKLKIWHVIILLVCMVSCATHEGVFSFASNDNYTVKTFRIKGATYSTPIKSDDNTVVFGTHKKSVYFINEDSIKSVYRTKLWIHATPELVFDSLISLGSYDGNLYFFNRNGKLEKNFRPHCRIYSNAVQLDSVWIAFATAFKGITFYNFLTDSTFCKKLPKFTHGSPLLLNGNSFCIGSNDGVMYFFDKIGNIFSRFSTDGWIMHSKAFKQNDSTIVFGSYDNNLYSISTSSDLVWKFSTNGKIHASPQQFSNGNIVCGSFDKNIYIIDRNGKLVNKIPTDKKVVSSATINGQEYAAVGSYDKHLYVFDNLGKLLTKIPLGGKIFSSPIFIDDNVIFCATTNGKACFIELLNINKN